VPELNHARLVKQDIIPSQRNLPVAFVQQDSGQQPKLLLVPHVQQANIHNMLEQFHLQRVSLAQQAPIPVQPPQFVPLAQRVNMLPLALQVVPLVMQDPFHSKEQGLVLNVQQGNIQIQEPQPVMIAQEANIRAQELALACLVPQENSRILGLQHAVTVQQENFRTQEPQCAVFVHLGNILIRLYLLLARFVVQDRFRWQARPLVILVRRESIQMVERGLVQLAALGDIRVRVLHRAILVLLGNIHLGM